MYAKLISKSGATKIVETEDVDMLCDHMKGMETCFKGYNEIVIAVEECDYMTDEAFQEYNTRDIDDDDDYYEFDILDFYSYDDEYDDEDDEDEDCD